MHTFLLRAEGVNLDSFIYDTQDLSTIRGGGLLLLNAADTVRDALRKRGTTSTPVVEGASIGLYFVESEDSPEQVRSWMNDALVTRLPHATFVVDVGPPGEDGPEARATVEWRNREQQMQAPSVVYPALEGKGAVCEVDLVRPAVEKARMKGRETWISDATKQRREAGNRAKQNFYKQELERVGRADIPLEFRFAQDFEEIGGNSAEWGNLQDKLALIYLDGNRFGERAAACKGRHDLRDFSDGVRRKHSDILAGLLDRIGRDEDKGWLSGADYNKIARLETLLWGGDEIIWVVPAWKGWETLRSFYVQCEAEANPAWNPLPDQPLTYTAALVFCHTRTPIHAVVKLAHNMADNLKERYKDKPENRFLYKVLESFDYVETPGAEMALPADALNTMEAGMPLWREQVSNKRLHRIQKLNGAERQKLDGEMRKGMTPEAVGLLDKLGPEGWRHIVELRDYVMPERGEA